MCPPSISKTTLTFLALTLALLAQNQLVCTDPILINTYCNPTSGNYLSGDPFETNLGQVLTSMILKVSSSSPFYSNVTAGSGVDKVYGLYYCIGFVKASDCNACVMAAVAKIQRSCTTKEAIVWYLECTLRYANRDIFSQLDLSPVASFPMGQNLSAEGAKTFPNVFPSSIDGVIAAAAFNTTSSPPAYARSVVSLSSAESLLALAQCTPVIVGATCNQCLRAAVANMSTCCSNQVGALVFLPSCELIYAVLNSSSSAPTPARNRSSSNGPNSNPSLTPSSPTPIIPTTPPAGKDDKGKSNGSSMLRSKENVVVGVLGTIGFLVFMSFSIAF